MEGEQNEPINLNVEKKIFSYFWAECGGKKFYWHFDACFLFSLGFIRAEFCIVLCQINLQKNKKIGFEVWIKS